MTATASPDSLLQPNARTSSAAEIASDAPAVPAKRPRALTVMAGLALAATTAVGGWYLHGVGHESTDDAQVEGHIMNVSARVSGQVAKVLVTDNQVVDEGQLLVQLDEGDLRAKADSARADLNAAKAQLESAKAQLALTEKNIDATVTQAKAGVTQAAATLTSAQATIAQGNADVEAARAKLSLAKLDLDRVTALRAQGALPQAEVDSAQTSYDTAKAGVDQAVARLAAAHAGTRGGVGGVSYAEGRLAAALTGPQQIDAQRAAVSLAEARVAQSAASLELAELNLSYTQIRAPHRGEISRRTVEIGQAVDPSRPLLAVVPTDDVWVVANFKEDQLREMHAGQAVEVAVDTFGRRRFIGHVDSIAGASGARFALLPPDNATGNYVKVVQRVPVLIRFDGDPQVTLRPGMSAEVTVDTRNR
jgi:membrane fusion protein (multidrug efflux system)